MRSPGQKTGQNHIRLRPGAQLLRAAVPGSSRPAQSGHQIPSRAASARRPLVRGARRSSASGGRSHPSPSQLRLCVGAWVVDLEWRVDMAAWLLGPAPGARSSLDRRTMGTVAWAVCVASRPLALTDVHRKRVWTRLTPIGVGRWPGTRSWEQCGSGSQRSA